MEKIALPVRDGVLRCGYKAPQNEAPVLVWVQGRNEWLEFYQEWSEIVCSWGWGFLTWDHRGQGGSSGYRGDIESFKIYVEDFQSVLQHFVSNTWVLGSHSLGGLISLHALPVLPLPQKAVFCCPLIEVYNLHGYKALWPKIMTLLRLGQHRWHGSELWRKEPLSKNPLTEDLDEVQTLLGYPSMGPTWQWIDEVYRALKTIPPLPKGLPAEAILASQDTVVSTPAAHAWAQREGLKTLMIPGRHVLLKAPQAVRQRVFEHLKDFLQ
jgi:alpha-beta hydrolase superfamily lysophospholipase